MPAPDDQHHELIDGVLYVDAGVGVPGPPCKLGRVYVLYGFCTDGHPTIYAAAESEEPLKARAERVLAEEDPLTATVEELFWEPSTGGGEQAQLDADGHCWLYIVRVERLAAS